MSGGSKESRQKRLEAERATALANIDADREARHARTEREQAARHAAGVLAVKSPWQPKQRRSSGSGRASGPRHSMPEEDEMEGGY